MRMYLTGARLDDRRPGHCDRCGVRTLVTPEIGPDAENVCDACLERERLADYLEYLTLLHEAVPAAGLRRTG